MKYIIPILTLICISNGFTQINVIDSGYTYWGLPKGAKARIGKSSLAGTNAITLSPDGTQLAAASEIGVWIYDTSTSKVIGLLQEHSGKVTSAAFSTDGKTLATGGVDTTIRLYVTETLEHKSTLNGHVGSVTLLKFLPDGKTLASGSRDDTIRLWNLNTGKLKYTLSGHSNGVNSITLSQDGNLLASKGWLKNLLWDTKTGKRVAVFQQKTAMGRNKVAYGALSPDGKILASWSGTPGIRLWDTHTAQHFTTLKHAEQPWYSAVALSPDGKTLASNSSKRNEILLWNLNTNEPNATLTGDVESISKIVFSPDGRTIAGYSSKHIQFWDIKTYKSLMSFPLNSYLYSLIFSDDGKISAAHNREEIHIWDVHTGQQKFVLTGHQEFGSSVSYLSDGSTLACKKYSTMYLLDTKTGKTRTKIQVNYTPTFSPDAKMCAIKKYKKPIQLWDTKTGTLKITLPETTDKDYITIVFSPDSKMLANSGNDGKIYICDIPTASITNTIPIHISSNNDVIFLPENKMLVIRNINGEVQLWDLGNGKLKQTLTTQKEVISYITYSPHADALAGVDHNGNIHLWDLETWTLQFKLSTENGTATYIRFSPDGKTLLSFSGRFVNSIMFWDVGTGRLKGTLNKEIEYRFPLQFSPNGKFLMTLSKERKSILLWNVMTRTHIATLTLNMGEVSSYSISTDSKTLASISDNGSIIFWDLTKYQK